MFASNLRLARPASMVGRLWALPCTLFGLLVASVALGCGARWSRQGDVIEVAFPTPRRAPGGFVAITLGQVVLACDEAALQQWRAHELVHVRQYLRWGPVFPLAYAAASLAAAWHSGRPYLDNHFEIQARRESARQAA